MNNRGIEKKSYKYGKRFNYGWDGNGKATRILEKMIVGGKTGNEVLKPVLSYYWYWIKKTKANLANENE